MSDTKPESTDLLIDPEAQSATPGKPAFLAKPDGAPVYHGFPLVLETMIDGWCYGAITAFADPKGCLSGDGYVQAPDGSRAGLVWEVGEGRFAEIRPPSPSRWGVYAVWFPRPIRDVGDLRDGFVHILPQLRERFERLKGGPTV